MKYLFAVMATLGALAIGGLPALAVGVAMHEAPAAQAAPAAHPNGYGAVLVSTTMHTCDWKHHGNM